jgi:hypothetical protein
MSHASLIVALSPADIATCGGIEAAIAHQMAPFDENGEWFAEGSRWDWWQVGGRWSGFFLPNYDPEKDPANIETCDTCGGTGLRHDSIGLAAREQDPTYTCNGCQGKGKKVKWPTEWQTRGNVALRAGLDEDVFREGHRPKYEASYDEYQAMSADAKRREGLFGGDHLPQEGETKEDFVKRRLESRYLSAYAFLKDRSWHEQARMGWFGAKLKTECEIKAEESGEEFKGRCLHKDEESGSQIVSYGSDERETEDRWDRLYWPRFLHNLPPETTLVMVDFHV